MNILIVGNGGREHALAWKLFQSKDCNKIYCTIGNAGISNLAEIVDISPTDNEKIVEFTKTHDIDLVVVGPEAPLVQGLADRLIEENIAVFGPSKNAARLEGSKGFMKDLCAKNNIPTASYARFQDTKDAKHYLEKCDLPIVIKADGLAAGKGVIIAHTMEEAMRSIDNILQDGQFGEAGTEIVIEEFLDGEELSYFALCDGKNVVPFGSAQDHKQIGEGDTGLNTGGMGAYSPAHMINEELEAKILEKIIMPSMKGLENIGCPFTGVLFAGIMLVNGEPFLLEYNVRFGDPECQTLMMRLDCDLLPILYACATGKLDDFGPIQWKEDTSICVVMAAKGYPETYVKNTIIKLENTNDESCQIFHAGTAFNDNNEIINTGGRVLGVTVCEQGIQNSQEKAYKTIKKIDWPEGIFRRDIGWRALNQECLSKDMILEKKS